MTEMVRIVARALAPHVTGYTIDALPKDRADLKAKFRSGEVEDINLPTQDDMCEIARAAINAMRVPTAEMLQAMHDGALGADDHEMDDQARQFCTDCWADMIVAAGANP